MKIFKSLNCPQCNLPFVSISDNPQSPRQLFCGIGLCKACFERERSLEKDQRSHQCTFINCLSNPLVLPPYFLNELLTNDSLELFSEIKGYILVKPIELPECPICHEEYSIDIEAQQPFRLRCNHLICNDCFRKIRENSSANPNWWKFKVTCPICKSVCLRSNDCVKKNNLLKKFLRELPQLVKQLEEMPKVENVNGCKYRCGECKENFSLEQMFNCINCAEKICGGCAFRKHRSHSVADLVVEEIEKIISDTERAVVCQIQCYKDLFPPLHEQLMEKISLIETGLIAKLSNVKRDNIVKAGKDRLDCQKFGDKFEMIAEKYVPTLREINSSLQELLNDPDLGVVQVSIFRDSIDPEIEKTSLIEEVQEENGPEPMKSEIHRYGSRSSRLLSLIDKALLPY